MSTGNKKKTRFGRGATVELPPGKFANFLASLRRGDVLFKLGASLLAMILLWVIVGAGDPAFSFRGSDVPQRDIAARVNFRDLDLAATERAREQARLQSLNVYDLDSEPLVQLKARLYNTLGDVITSATLEDFGQENWSQFETALPEGIQPGQETTEERFERFRGQLTGEGRLKQVQLSIEQALSPFIQRGLLAKLPEQHSGDQQEIYVQPITAPPGAADRRAVVRLEDALIRDGSALRKALKLQLESDDLTERIFVWLHNKLPETLKWNESATDQARELAAGAVPERYQEYKVGQPIAKGGVRLSEKELRLLYLEHDAYIDQLGRAARLSRSAATFCLIVGVFCIAGYYLALRGHPALHSLPRLCGLLFLSMLTVALARWLCRDEARAELIPLLVFGMTMAIAYSRESAILLTVSIAVISEIAIGRGLNNFILLVGPVAMAVTQLDAIRSRLKLILVGLMAGAVGFALTLAIGVLRDQPATLEALEPILRHGGRNALWAVFSGFLLTGLLPLIERWFGVLTDIRLLELADVAHPLLQELVRRAPGTYNHSINVASIAEAAADSIGARGLLVRVGAYFHDIGKMLKPNYFVENQGAEGSRHESLVPAMSTLIIIAHIKDGADLARRYKVPEPIIDFIEQHHGTTLVEYFYRRASERSEANPDSPEVDESDFRYPGPKPQTKEAAVLMLADAVESASRSLAEPAPARIETLVREIAMKRLLDGQFDESSMNLTELRNVQDSLVKSLTAVYHGRIKYPDQRTA